MKFFAALLLLAAVSSAQAATCVIQTGESKEPSTDDTIGACISQFVLLELFDGNTFLKTVNKLTTTDTVNGTPCVRNTLKEQAAVATLKEQAAQLQSQGQCSKIEVDL